jgi:adenylate cyclase class 2
MNRANQEVEIKLRVPDARALRLRLKELKAREIIPRKFESNTLYETVSRNLTRHGQLIRIRIEQPSSRGLRIRPGKTSNAVLTYKGPCRSSQGSQAPPRKKSSQGRFKVREEVELVLGSGEQMAAILRALGLRPVFRYEKFRTTYALPGIRALKVEFDETPIGLFLELEGRPAAIDHASKLLKYTPADYLSSTYGALYIAECRRRGRKPTNMLFQPTKNLR